ncbi:MULTISPECIES: FKBP-type peptidyl-prolyl cis-trans isomerase [Mycobacteriales]|uniref:Peptidyl-prolyl cis-trans isomerase n=1 Tax=Gordonia rubripertincta TaxID=36822 RepID=A0ABT4MPX5_GORRU|nr:MULTISPECIES: FKBP-type peptidyl-prolyl cis-trans isomerase [Mycobacteriales]MCZ4549028.1 FKBP-type peptidyl-prolyl cis-trans isomerase [Gordonia rubripertincta]
MTLKRLSLTIVASSALFLAACGSDESSDTTESTTAGATGTAAAATCPTAAPAGDVAPEWTLQGTTGSVEVTGSTDSAAPKVTVSSPFSVDATQVQTLTEGTGAVVPETAEVSVCYMGVNGRDGNVFDSSYETGSPVDFPLTGVIPGFQKAIAGQKVGSTVGVAMSSADGYATGQPAAGIEAGDSLIFAIKILSAQG